jgi:hypothetical protein
MHFLLILMEYWPGFLPARACSKSVHSFVLNALRLRKVPLCVFPDYAQPSLSALLTSFNAPFHSLHTVLLEGAHMALM